MEVVTRYSNNPTLLDDLRHARELMLSRDEDDEPELGGPPESWPSGSRSARAASSAWSAGRGAGSVATSRQLIRQRVSRGSYVVWIGAPGRNRNAVILAGVWLVRWGAQRVTRLG